MNEIIPMTEWTKLKTSVIAKHKKVSNTATPKGKIKERPDGYSYVEDSYMSQKALELYGPTSFEKQWIEVVYTSTPQVLRVNNADEVHMVKSPEWILYAGLLSFVDEGMVRKETGVGGARVQYKREKPHTPDNIVDLDKVIKSARTNARKDAINRSMSIADDVYQREMDETPTMKEVEACNMLLHKTHLAKLLNETQVKAVNDALADPDITKAIILYYTDEMNKLLKKESKDGKE